MVSNTWLDARTDEVGKSAVAPIGSFVVVLPDLLTVRHSDHDADPLQVPHSFFEFPSVHDVLQIASASCQSLMMYFLLRSLK